MVRDARYYQDDAPAEDVFVFPASWRKHLHRRRGGVPGPKVKVSADPAGDVRAFLSEHRHGVFRILDHRHGDAEVREAGNRYIREEIGAPHRDAEVTPLGVAAVAFAVHQSGGWTRERKMRDFADAWIAQHGLVFAARAGAEIGGLVAEDIDHRVAYVRRRRPDDKPHDSYNPPLDVLARIRTRIAVCSDDEYAQIRAALADYRDGPLRQRVAVSFLMPSETGWVEEDCAAGGDDLLVHSLHTPDQLSRIVDRRGRLPYDQTPAMYATLLDGVGTECVAPLLLWFGRYRQEKKDHKLLQELLSYLPAGHSRSPDP